MSLSSGKKGIGSRQHDLAIEIHNISPLDTSNQILLESKVLG
jgi:hypothetical protein